MVEVMKIMATSFEKSCAHTATLHSVFPTLHQGSANPRLRWRLLDTHRQVWVSFLCGHCSFLLGPGARKVLFVSSKTLFLQSCVSSIIKSHWPPKSNSLGVLSPFFRYPGWKICCGSYNFLNSVLQFVGHLLSGSMVGLMAISYKRAYATGCVTQVTAPRAPAPAADRC